MAIFVYVWMLSEIYLYNWMVNHLKTVLTMVIGAMVDGCVRETNTVNICESFNDYISW